MTNATQTTLERLLCSYPKTIPQMLPCAAIAVILSVSMLLTSCDTEQVLPDSPISESLSDASPEEGSIPETAEERTLFNGTSHQFSGNFYQGRSESSSLFSDRARIIIDVDDLATRINERSGEYQVTVALHPNLTVAGRIAVRMRNAHPALNLEVLYPNGQANVFILKFTFPNSFPPSVIDGRVIIDLNNQGVQLPSLSDLVQEVSESAMCCAGDATVVLDDLAPFHSE